MKESNINQKRTLSVVIPVFNCEKYISQCVESVLNQSLSSIEVILVDDGSTDLSSCLCDEFAQKDKRIRVIHQENRGPVVARYRGLIECTSDYVTFVDSDDYVDGESFIYAMDCIKGDLDIVCAGSKIIYDGESPYPRGIEYAEGLYNKQDLETIVYKSMIWNEKGCHCGFMPSLCTKIFKRTLLNEIYEQYKDLSIKVGDDSLIAFTYLYKCDSAYMLDIEYYNYRQRKRGTIEPYFLDEDFFDKVYLFYENMRNVFINDKRMMRQIDLYYVTLVEQVRRKYDVIETNASFMFPFHQVAVNDRVVLYGAGKVGKIIHSTLISIPYCQVVAWVDRNYDNDIIFSREIMHSIEFDKIVITITDLSISKIIKQELIDEGFDAEKILFVIPINK